MVSNSDSSLNNPNLGLRNSTAKESIILSGKKIPEGKETSRVLAEKVHNKALYIAAKTETGNQSLPEKIYNKIFYVQLELLGKKTYININSIVKRLHISRSEVMQASKENRIPELIELASKTADATLKSYKKIIKNADPSLNSIKGTILKTIKTVITTGKPVLFSAKPHVLSPKKINALVINTNSKKDHLQLNVIDSTNVLGTGNFAKVVGSKGTQSKDLKLAVKLPHENKLSKDMQREVRNLRKLNQEGAHRGIQGTAWHISNQKGIVTELLDGSYFHYMHNENNEANELPEILNEFDQLLDGLAYVHKKQIIHADLKPENIFYKKESQQSPELFIGDFGESVDMTVEQDWKEWLTPGTKMYTLENEATPIYKRDVFSMGCIFYNRLTGGQHLFKEYSLVKSKVNGLTMYCDEGHPIPESGYNPFPYDVPKELQELIERMTNLDPAQRPTAKEAHKLLKEIKSSYPS